MTVLNKRKVGVVLEAVNIMRPGKWGNPFILERESDRAAVLDKYLAYLIRRPDLIAAAKIELRGRDLLCCCAPKACHGDILHAIANSR